MRFVGLALEDRVPDTKTIWLYRDQLTRAAPSRACSPGSTGFLRGAAYSALGGQIDDATVIAVRRPRLTRGEKSTITGGRVLEKLVAGETCAEWTPTAAGR